MYIKFKAKIEIIGVNPFVFLPERVLKVIFKQARKTSGKIPVKMKIDGHVFIQTLIKYSGHWRLYLNMPMRKAAGKDVGDTATFEVAFDAGERKVPVHPKLQKALDENEAAKLTFNALSPSRRLEIVRYINFLKTEETVEKNVMRAISFLSGEAKFVGRDKP